MNTLFATALALSTMTSVAFAQQQPPPPVPAAAAAAQTAPAIPSPTAVPEVIAPKDPSPQGRDAPPPPRDRDWVMKEHHGRMPPPPPSKAAHFKIKSGRTMIDIKCAEDEPTKVCADVLNQVMDKLTPSSGSYEDDNSQD